VTAGRGAIAFAERLLNLLELGSFAATYKYALLTAIIDLCLEQPARLPPSVLTTRQLAEKVVELYWPHAIPYDGATILRQGGARKGNQAEILSAIAGFRSRGAGGATDLLHRARLSRPSDFERLVQEVEWKLIEMPIPRLQVMGGEEDRFLYDYRWTTSVARSTVGGYQRGYTGAFDSRLLLRPRAAEHLIELSGVLRPVIRREWALMVAEMNDLPESKLEDFLFGAARVSLDAVRDPLRELQFGRCFYCEGRVDDRCDVDHFIPWARYADNSLDNLVATHPRCNGQKRDFFAALPHLERWAGRSARLAAQLDDLAQSASWPREPKRTMAVARAMYTRLPEGARLWIAGDRFEHVDPPRLGAVFAA